MTTATLRVGGSGDRVETVGRVALATQGLLYVIMGVLALQVAAGDHGAEPSQRGALEAVVRQPFGKALLVVVLVGLVAHALWRIVLAIRGEPGPDDDAGSLAKRLGNVGRAAIYIGFIVAGVKLLSDAGSSSSGRSLRVTSCDDTAYSTRRARRLLASLPTPPRRPCTPMATSWR